MYSSGAQVLVLHLLWSDLKQLKGSFEPTDMSE